MTCNCDPVCLCGTMLQDPTVRCEVHPDVRVKNAYERMDFEKAWDAKVEANGEAT